MSTNSKIILLKVNRMVVAKAFIFFTSCFLLAQSASAATVYNCSRNGKRCVAKLETGSVGDKVRVLDEKARQIARGRIIKRRGAYAIISLTKIAKTVRRGFPVLVDVDTEHSSFEWAATFSYRE